MAGGSSDRRSQPIRRPQIRYKQRLSLSHPVSPCPLLSALSVCRTSMSVLRASCTAALRSSSAPTSGPGSLCRSRCLPRGARVRASLCAYLQSQPGAMGLFDADGEEGGGLFGADGPAKAAPQAERDTGSSMIVASLFATEDSDAGSVDFERLIGGGVVAIREAESDSGSDSGSESSATSAAEPAERRYRVVAEAGAIIREKFDLESEYVRTAEAGEVLESISTKVTDKGVVRVETAEGWVSQTTADGSTKLLHWLGAKEEPKPEPEPEPEPVERSRSRRVSFRDDGHEPVSSVRSTSK